MRTIGVFKEDGKETRVALIPEVVAGIIKDQLAQVLVMEGAGLKAGFLDDEYRKAGATIVHSTEEVFNNCQCLVSINGSMFAQKADVKDKLLISLFDPFFNRETMKDLCKKGASVLSLELIPRISRAQSMDVLSSQANIAGYMAVLLVASRLNKVIPLMMTAAGTIKPAKILILGAGVAGLAAIATAKRLGALVFAYDVRAAVKEQVESLGAKFVEIKLSESGEGSGGYAKALSAEGEALQRQKLTDFAKDMDAIITTALIPGVKAPRLLDDRIFSIMKKDSVIIDMAAKSGGNVSGSVVDEWVSKDHVWLYGADQLARLVPKDASFTFSKNIKALLDLILLKDQQLNIHDEIMQSALICHQGDFINQAFLKSNN